MQTKILTFPDGQRCLHCAAAWNRVTGEIYEMPELPVLTREELTTKTRIANMNEQMMSAYRFHNRLLKTAKEYHIVLDLLRDLVSFVENSPQAPVASSDAMQIAQAYLGDQL